MPLIVSVQRECLRKKFSWSTCLLCVDACPGKALYFGKDNVTFEQKKCDQCGLCALVCPVNAISGSMPLRQIEGDLLHSDPRTVPLVKELLLYHHAGVRHVHLNVSHTSWLPVIEEVNVLLVILNRPAFTVQQNDKPVEYVSSARRSLLGLRRRRPLSITNTALNEVFPGYRFYTLSLDEDACFLCGACKNVCPSQCIEINKDAVSIQTHQCIGCALCVDACPKGALTMTGNVAAMESLLHPLKKYTCSCCANTYSDFDGKSDKNQLCSTCKLRKNVGIPPQVIGQNSIAGLYRSRSW